VGLRRAVPLGVAVGVLSGLFGIGGGVLVVVGLVTFGFAQHAAHATSLAAIILTSLAAVVPFALDGAVAVDAVLALALSAAIGAVIGAAIMHRLPERALRWIFAAFLVLTAVRMLAGIDTPAEDAHAALTAAELALCAGIGLGTGIVSAVLGVGGGIVMVPALVLVLGFSQHAAEGTSLAVVVPTALVGALRHGRSGYTDWRSGLEIGIGGIAGGVLGAVLALALDASVLQRLFGVFLLVMAGRLLWSSRREGGDQGEGGQAEA
jgi:uncharacterized protein